jgi:hypothetical protein
MSDARFLITGAGSREVNLRSYLDPAAEEAANAASRAWIKSLRRAIVDGQELRARFTYRGDSLWWFAELYLHKQQVIAQIHRTILALHNVIDREQPTSLEFISGGHLARGIAPQVATARNLDYTGPRGFGRPAAVRLAAIDARAATLTAASLASRLRPGSAPVKGHYPKAVAFVHRAFWRSEAGQGADEQYIGPVLQALEQRLEKGALTYVTLGPMSNFRARRWWHPLRSAGTSDSALPIEAYAPLSALVDSRRVWRGRHRARRALVSSRDLREHSVIEGCDCWPIVREELAGIALLQWPWSTRAMDEAAAALDTLQPRVAVTYAEAGGWGRALVLECRRRGIPSVGLQHGFIYRHWLNYLHEADEMDPHPADPADAGFPRPTATLLFDEYAAHHLVQEGRFPAGALQVTGSPRLDALADQVRRLGDAEIETALAKIGPPFNRTAVTAIVLVATKYREAQHALPSLVDAAATLRGVHLLIKTHPAETPEMYSHLASGRTHVTVLDASTPVAALLRASRALVTVNSTMALDAAVLNVPAIVIGLPNNLSPFVDAGVMMGLDENAPTAEIARQLERFLYDEELRQGLARVRADFLTRFHIRADGGAAARTADAVLRLAGF